MTEFYFHNPESLSAKQNLQYIRTYTIVMPQLYREQRFRERRYRECTYVIPGNVVPSKVVTPTMMRTFCW